jgi:hypothetical protein
MNVLFVIGRLNIAGGVYIAAKMAEVLAATGRHDVALAVWDWKSVTGASWFARPESVAVVPFESAADRRWDVVFGTWWETLLVLPQFPARTYAHFMQALESAFVPWGEPHQPLYEFLLESNAFPSLTTARWMLNHASQPAACVLAGLDRELFRPAPPLLARDPGRLRCLVEGPLVAPRKNVGQTLELLDRLELEYLVAGPDANKTAVGPHCVGTVCVPLAAMAAVYSSADVLVKCSSAEGMFGPPLEMFACGGTAVCWDVAGAEEYMVHGYNSLLAPVNSFGAVADALARLREDAALLGRLRTNAQATAAAWPAWPEIAPALERALARVAAVENEKEFRQLVELALQRFDWAPPER